MQKLTDRQRAVLDYIASSIDDRGYPPTLREIGNHLGIRSTNGVNDHLRALERKGYLTREDMKSRTLRPTGLGESMARRAGQARAASAVANLAGEDGPVHGRLHGMGPGDPGRDEGATERRAGPPTLRSVPTYDNVVDIPIVGRVAAGALSEAIEAPEDTVRVDRMLLGSTRDVFGLRIAGDSMIDAGIHDGDYVFVRKQLNANRGDIVVALVGEDATCKYYYPERDHIRLQPANDQIAPILLPKNDWRSTQILGVVVGVYRKIA